MNIISASRRTDLPAFYFDQFLMSLQNGFIEVTNPFNKKDKKIISLNKNDIAFFVFWTKYPINIIKNYNKIKDYRFYVLYTLNPYPAIIEPDFKNKKYLIELFKKLSDIISPSRVIWRYDPIIYSSYFNENYHQENFEFLASKLSNYTNKFIVSFVQFYRKNIKKLYNLGIKKLDYYKKLEIINKLNKIAKKYNIELNICCDEIVNINFNNSDIFNNYNIYDSINLIKSSCINSDIINNYYKTNFIFEKDKNQRLLCNCSKSIDIGNYKTCKFNCIYCYAK